MTSLLSLVFERSRTRSSAPCLWPSLVRRSPVEYRIMDFSGRSLQELLLYSTHVRRQPARQVEKISRSIREVGLGSIPRGGWDDLRRALLPHFFGSCRTPSGWA